MFVEIIKNIFSIIGLCGTILTLYSIKEQKKDSKILKNIFFSPSNGRAERKLYYDGKFKEVEALYKKEKYNSSIKNFQKICNDNFQYSAEAESLINIIFWQETKRILGDRYPKDDSLLTVEVIVFMVINRRVKDKKFILSEEKYSECIVKFLDIYKETWGGDLSSYRTIIYIINNDQKIESSLQLLKPIGFEEMDEIFIKYIKKCYQYN